MTQPKWLSEILMKINGRDDWIEVVGVANRSCFDLEQHMKATGTDLRAFRHYDEPEEREVEQLKPDMAKLGKIFRKDAPFVKEYLESIEPPFPENIKMDLKKVYRRC